tara:strand:- start:583 stop:1425 length:843 start_codon:yes stop_codon:yes gene_type:complete
MDISSLLQKSTSVLKDLKFKTPALDTELILAKALQTTREDILTNQNKILTNKQFDLFNTYFIQRLKKKPVAYILGNKEFWKSNFAVNQNVLIPRPDTELIIQEALRIFDKYKSINILDIGTGSGCIILSLLKELKLSRGVGIDISIDSIKVAKINAKLQQMDNRVNFIKSNIDNYNTSNYDLIVSNPPYIKKFKLKSLSEDVKNFEPNIALDGGPTGKALIQKVIKKSSKLLKRKGILILEFDNDQIYFTKKTLIENDLFPKKIVKGISGYYRCMVSIKN